MLRAAAGLPSRTSGQLIPGTGRPDPDGRTGHVFMLPATDQSRSARPQGTRDDRFAGSNFQCKQYRSGQPAESRTTSNMSWSSAVFVALQRENGRQSSQRAQRQKPARSPVKPEASGEITPQGLHGCCCCQCSSFRPQHPGTQPQGLPARRHGCDLFLATQSALGAGQ